MTSVQPANSQMASVLDAIVQPIPSALLLIILIFAVHRVLRTMFFLPFKGKLWKIELRDTISVVKDDDKWNVIEIQQKEIENTSALKLDANNVVNDSVLFIKLGWRIQKCRVRIWQNIQGAEDTIKLHPRLAEKLQIAELIKSLSAGPDSSAASFSLRLRHPFWFFLLPFYFHPDPGVRLQWNLGFLFLLLGFVMPKLLDPLVAKAFEVFK